VAGLRARQECPQQRDIETRNRLRLYGSYEKEVQVVLVENARALHELVARHDWPVPADLPRGLYRIGTTAAGPVEEPGT